MRRETRLGLIAFAVVAFIGLRCWPQGRQHAAEGRQAVFVEATAAMMALNQADETFPDAIVPDSWKTTAHWLGSASSV